MQLQKTMQDFMKIKKKGFQSFRAYINFSLSLQFTQIKIIQQYNNKTRISLEGQATLMTKLFK